MVKLLRLLAMVLVTAVFAGCGGDDDTISGRTGGDAPEDGRQGEKPKPVVTEGIRPLVLQKPTLTESEFLNVMQLPFGEFDQAAFTFTFAPKRAGSLFFSNIQSRLHLEGCTKETARSVKFNVVWQEDLGTKRSALLGFTPDITEYDYLPAKKYMLTYVLLDLKGDLSDCASATLKFAAFDKNYGKSEK